MRLEVASSSLALCVLLGCSVDVHHEFEGPPDAGLSGGSGGQSAGSGGGGASGAMSDEGAGSGGGVPVGGTTASSAGRSGGGGHDDADASIPEPSDDSAPDYGELAVLPDTSTEKVASCAGQPDMTLCNVTTVPDRWYDVCVDEVCVSPGCGDQTCNTPGPHFRMPPHRDHDALQLQPGDEPVTIDLITGLHWQSCSAGQTGAGCAGTPTQLHWDAALAYCDQLSWGGHDDWYLPDPYELVSILEDDLEPGAVVALNPTAFPNQAGSTYHWSTASMGPDQAMMISSYTASLDPITSQQHVMTDIFARCVRRGFSTATSPAHARYAQGPGPSFTDHATGLVWPSCLARIPDATECSDLMDKVTVERALERCAQLTWDGSSSWRVPSFKEMYSLLVYPRDVATTMVMPDPRVVDPAGPFLITNDGHLISTDGRRVDLESTYPYLCVRGPVADAN
jgi:hypothetical protein